MITKKHISFVLFALILALVGRAGDYLLYWQVTGEERVDGTLIGDFVAADASKYNFLAGGYSGIIAGARAVFFDGSENDPHTMNLYERGGPGWEDKGSSDVVIVDEKDLSMIGSGEVYSYIPGDPSSLSFMIELGNWEEGEWVTLAVSEVVNYDSLTVNSVDGKHIFIFGDDLSFGNFQPWAPTYTIPEPSSGLLALIGAALLALRRRRT